MTAAERDPGVTGSAARRDAKTCFDVVCKSTRGMKGKHVRLHRGPVPKSWAVTVTICGKRVSHAFTARESKGALYAVAGGNAAALLLAPGTVPPPVAVGVAPGRPPR